MAKLHLEGGVTFEGTPEEIKAYTDLYVEKAEEKEPEAPKQAFKVGEYIVGNDASRYGITNDKMTLGKVVKEYTDRYNDIRVEVLRHATEPCKIGNGYDVQSKYFRKATAEEIADYEESLKPTFKTGDIVVITWNTNDHEFEIGEVARIKESDREDDAYKVEYMDGHDWWWVYESEMRHATQAEREQYEANAKQAEKDAIFTKIGRKPGEFKKGDIVRVSTRADAHKVAGSLVTIAEFREGGNCGGLAWLFEDYGCSITGQYLELIAPVESRVDSHCV